MSVTVQYMQTLFLQTLATSKYGSQTGNPRPIRSMAARLSGVWAGSLLPGGASTKYARALPGNNIQNS